MFLNSTIAMLLLTSSTKLETNETEAHPQMVNNTLVIDIVSSVHEIYKFHNFVFYISERLIKNTDTANIFFQNFWDAFPTAPCIIFINNAGSMDGFLSTPSLMLVLTTERDDPIMEIAAQSLKGVRFFKTIFILFPIVGSDDFYNSFEEYQIFYENIRLMYEWIWQQQFLNTLLITIRNNIYIHDPYPISSIINKTDSWRAKDFFQRYDLDFKGYHIQSPIYHDLPRVFRMTRKQIGEGSTSLTGVSGKFFLEFVDFINATFNDTFMENQEVEPLNINAVIHMIEERQLEISINSYTSMFKSLAATSYPIGINDWCIMVPFRNRSPDQIYLQKSFADSSWYLLCFFILYITGGIWICTPTRERDLTLSFIQSICSMILSPPLRILLLPQARVRFLFIVLFIMGFFITIMYVTKLTSFLTTPTTQEQINTVQDIIEANLQIMIMDYELELIKHMNYPKRFLDLIVVSSKLNMDQHRDRFNTSYGYSIQSDRWIFLNKQQQYLRKPIFRLTTICMGPYYHVFPIQSDSHLANPLQDFIMSCIQFGFMQYWQSEAFADALFLNYVHMILVNEEPLPLTLTFFRSICYIWWLGLIMAGLAFICEMKGITFAVCSRGFGNCFHWFKLKICNCC